MGEFSFPKRFHLQRPGDFHRVYAGGLKRHTRGFVVFRRPNRLDHPRLGLSIGKKYGSAVHRNRMKRLVREVVRLNWRQWRLEGTDIVVIARRSAGGFHLEDVRSDFSKLFDQSGER